MNAFQAALSVGIFLGLSACSGEPPEQADESPGLSENNPFKSQVDTLNETKKIEGLLQDSARERDRHLEEQSR